MTQEQIKRLEERVKRLEDWINSMHIILKAHSGAFLDTVADEESLANLALLDQVHALLEKQMNKYLKGIDESEE